MKTLYKSIALVVLIAALGLAQTALTTTTLSSAVAITDKQVTLASGSGVTVMGTSNSINTVLYVDKELMRIKTLVSGTTYVVERAVGGTKSAAHASGTKVYLGDPAGNFFLGSRQVEPFGACVAADQVSLPLIYTDTGRIYDCRSSLWFKIADNGTASSAGSAVRAFCTGTAGSAETEYLNNAACSGATSSTARHVVTQRGVLADLYVYSSANVAGGTGKDVITVVKNGSDTAVTCTVAGSAATCSDVTHAVAVAPGDVLTFKFVSATSDTAANVSVGATIY